MIHKFFTLIIVFTFCVVTDEPDLSRTARSIVDENGVWLYHENINPTENGFWVEAKDLRVGDVVMGANGELSVLVLFRVTFENYSTDKRHTDLQRRHT